VEAWREKLGAGDLEAAWELFITRYERLIVATIRRTIPNDDEIADVRSEICASLIENDLELLRRHSDSGKARFSTWLVTVVHHRAIDWVRHREGRRRISPPPELSPIQQRIFHHIFVERRSHVEGYEVMHQRSDPGLSFGDYLKEVAQTYRVIAQTGTQTATPSPAVSLDQTDPAQNVENEVATREAAAVLAKALTQLPADERLAVKLFVIDELPAASVAQIVGWPNAKSVYNRVYRTLSTLRRELEIRGIDPTGV
jgi:RNA polymerase sigma factor (sigma-70 family)